MKLLDIVREVRQHLEENGRVSVRLLRRQYELDDEALDELVEELVDVQRVARREENILVWAGPARSEQPAAQAPPARHQAAQAETRKVISIIFADLMGSTALQERLDPESVNRVMDAYYQAVRGPVEAGGGTVVQLLGDGVLCAFGIPTIREDDALRAVRAAVEVHQAFREFLATQQWLSVPIGLRVAVNTGEVVVSEEHPAGIGDPLNVAARLQQEARDGEVLIGQATRRLVADAVTLEQAGVFTLKGRAETVTAYRVMSLVRPTGAAAAAFVGRTEELARLTAVYEAALAAPAARLAVLVASPGQGKSRLIEEVSGRLADAATVVKAHCDAVGGATFAPMAEALRGWLAKRSADPSDAADRQATLAAALPEGTADRDRILAGITALLAGSPASPEETFFVIRRLLTALGQEKPVVLVIDDLHWAEPLLLDLVEHLIQWGSGVPLFVLIGARPELRELRSSLVTPGGLVSDLLMLAGLDAGAAMRLAANVIGASDLPAAVAAKVLATSEGNPLFVGELVRMLVDEGAIEREGDRWIVGANLAALEMPPTIHALLAARIERLRPEERSVLERAAVVGRHFSRGAVAALLGHNGTELDARLEALRRTELIEPDAGWFLGEPVQRFHHVLIRDAAYRRLLKGTRAELHQRLADWIEARASDVARTPEASGGLAEHDETIGWHLEQAHLLLREIGPLDAKGQSLGERAAQRLAAAGRRALARDDLPVAADLLGRAIECLSSDDATRADLALDWCEALLSAGDVARAAGAIAEFGRFAGSGSGEEVRLGSAGFALQPETEPRTLNPEPRAVDRSGRLRAWHTCFTAQLTVLTAPQELQAAADSVAAAAIQLAALGDAAGEAKAHSVNATALARLGKGGACEAALDQALAAARRGGDRRRANAVLAGAPLAALWGPSPVTRASGRCLDVVRVLRITRGAPAVESVALSCQGVLEALRGRTEAARRMLASSRKMVEDLGIAQRLFEADAFAGRIAAMEGDDVGAERLLRSAYVGLRDLGLGIDAARAGALLARTLLTQERSAEAEVLSHESEALAGDDLQAAIAWRGVRAEALAQRGEHGAAIELAKAAVAIASATDALLDHADARVALAVALHAASRDAEAKAEEHRALELWEAKGATLLAERARRSGPRASEARQEKALEEQPSEQPARRGHRRVLENAATANGKRVVAAVAARDAAALADLLADDMETVHHPTGAVFGKQGNVDSIGALIASRDLTFGLEPIATLGDALVLWRHLVTSSGAPLIVDSGAMEDAQFVLGEVDDQGRGRRTEFFADNHLGDAILRLYERYAVLLPDGPERTRAAAMAQSFAAMLTAVDLGRLEAAFAADIEMVDHRTLGTWIASGAQAALQHFHTLHEVAADLALCDEEILGLEPWAMLVRRIHSGSERLGGGVYEREFLALLAGGADGRLLRLEWFDDDREAEALARFEEIVAGGAQTETPREPFANAASRSLERNARCWAARDWDGALAILSPSLRFEDRRRLMRIEIGYEDFVAQFRMLFDQPASRWRETLIATRGERLALTRTNFEAEVTGGGGPLAFDEHLSLTEVDADGRWIACVTFDLEDLDAAYAELDARFEAGEASAYPRLTGALATNRLSNARDWRAYAARLAPDVVHRDHRRLGWGDTGHDAETLMRMQQSAFDLSPDARYRADHVRLAARGILLQQTLLGTRDGGVFENPMFSVAAVNEQGRVASFDTYDIEDRDRALARFAALAGGKEPAPDPLEEPFANAATRAVKRGTAALAARDWEAFASLMAPDFRHYDRTRIAQLETDGREWLASFRQMLEMTTELPAYQFLATRGERLALFAILWRGAAGDLGPSEIDWRVIVELNDRGEHTAIVAYDADDLEAAYAELEARWAAGEATAHPVASKWLADYLRFFAARDWTAMTALFTPDLVGENHRLVGWGTRQGPEGVVSTLRAQIELAPDTQERVDHVRTSEHAVLFEYAWCGTREGGAFENPWLVLVELAPDGRACRADVWEPEQLAHARARFTEIAARDTATAPFENAASRAWREVNAAWRQRDLERFAALHPAALRYRDHRRLVQLDLDRDEFLVFTRPLLEMRSTRASLDLLATRGERLALMRSTLEMADEVVGPSAIDSLMLIETDDRGAITAYDRYEIDDEQDARVETQARWEAGEASAHPRASSWQRDLAATQRQPDPAVMVSFFAPEFVAHDHRLVGWGTLHGAAAFFETLRMLNELAPDVSFHLDHMRTMSRGILSAGAWVGTREGGAFESPLMSVVELDAHGRAVSLDLYDPHHLERALARFEELRPPSLSELRRTSPDVLRIPANAMTRVWDRWQAAYGVGDEVAARAVYDPSYRFEDRRRLFRMTLDLDGTVANDSHIFEGGWRPVRTLLATAGDRLALQHVVWTTGEAGDASEIEMLELDEMGAEGHLTSSAMFDPEDRAAAQAELFERYVAGGADGMPRGAIEYSRGLNERDLARARTGLCDDFVLEDHRRTGMGHLEGGDAYIASVAAAYELTRDLNVHALYIAAMAPHGRVLMVRAAGTNAEGGDFETIYAALMLYRDERIASFEFFEPEELDAALARFEALRPQDA